jgi:hypothetical protein
VLLGNIRKGLLLFLSLLVASAVSAAPTVGDCSSYLVAPPLSPSPDAPAVHACPRQEHSGACEINQIGEPTNSQLASVAAELFKPPVATDLQAQSISAKSLPPVPSALFMALSGFLCVSLVKDRRVWLAALAGLLWLGQTGFAALPQLASHLCSKKQIQQQSPTSLTYVSQLEGSFRLRSNFVIRNSLFDIHYSACCISSPSDRSTFSQREDRFRLPQSAILPQFSLIQTNFCSAVRTEQIVSFSPAFIFARLARGPPELTSYVIPAKAGIQ